MRNLLVKVDQYLEEGCASVLFVCFIALMFYNVVMRYVFKNALPWAEEATLLLFVWFVWFSIPYATKLASNARVGVLQDLLPQRVKAGLNLLLDAFSILIFVTIISAAIDFLNHSAVRGKTGLLIPYPMWLFYLPAPVGLVLTIYRLIPGMKKNACLLFAPNCEGKGI